ncbi:MAG: ABC transporter ATP-binding protein [Nitriliruptoraceae bacterium]
MTTSATLVPAVHLARVTRTYGAGHMRVDAIDAADLQVPPGELVVVLGPSGSGKTTLLNLVGGIDQPTAGELEVDGQRLGAMDDAQLTAFRRDHVGFVFQFFNLVPTLTARENVALVLELTGHGEADTADSVLEQVGLADRADHFPGQLSGGEQQRVAIARAIAKQPPLLLCDEPTGALDLDTGRQILGVIQQLHRDRGMAVLLVTHNAVLADMANRVVRMRSGQIVADEVNDAPVDADQLVW